MTRNQLPKLTFIAWGPEREPAVQTISPHAWAHYLQATDLGNRRGSEAFRLGALRDAFGPGVQTIVPAWVDEPLTDIVADYIGPHADRVKQLCAVILLRDTFERPAPEAPPSPPAADAPTPRKNHGGKRARLSSPQPVLPMPGGAFVTPGAP